MFRPNLIYTGRMKWGYGILVLAAAMMGAGCSSDAGLDAPPAGGYDAQYVLNTLAQARTFAAEGNHESALKRFVWYHENALKYAEDQKTIRLTFALTAWMELAKKYPKAKEELTKIRDKTWEKAKAEGADPELYNEVEAITYALGDMASARQLYYDKPDLPLAERRVLANIDEVVKFGDKKWLADIVGDADKTMAALQAHHKAQEGEGGGGGGRGPRGGGGALGNDLAAIVKAAAAASGPEAGKAVQAKALEIVDSRAIRSALEAPEGD